MYGWFRLVSISMRVAGGSQALFRVRMNDNVVEGESIPQLVDVSPYSPIATATSIIVQGT